MTKYEGCEIVQKRLGWSTSHSPFDHINYTNQDQKIVNVLEAKIGTWNDHKFITWIPPRIEPFQEDYFPYSICCMGTYI
jgi:hypothetical protein